MDEINIINTIKKITGSEYIGDDCAYLKDLNIVISQDSLVEDIHFKREWCTPYQLGYKSATVNISDIIASGAIPKYFTVSLSLPNNISSDFIEQFYLGINSALNGIQVVGGDITGSPDKILISITALGITTNRNISSRKYARPGYIVITKGMFGSSAAGLNELKTNGNNISLIKSHLEPELDYNLSQQISTTIKEQYAMMDSSDGLADALYKIAESSGVSIDADYQSIPHLPEVAKDYILFGGEDYNLVAAIPESYINLFPDVQIIGRVKDFSGYYLNIAGNKFSHYNELNVFNHFGDNNE